MKVKDVMARNPISIDPQALVDGRLVRLLTEQDMLKALGEGYM